MENEKSLSIKSLRKRQWENSTLGEISKIDLEHMISKVFQ